MISLRPGTYSVKFELPGFGTVQRAGIELTAAFTATVNADMKVGGLEESVTVSARAPVVDVKSVTQQRSVTATSSTRCPPPRPLARSVP